MRAVLLSWLILFSVFFFDSGGLHFTYFFLKAVPFGSFFLFIISPLGNWSVPTVTLILNWSNHFGSPQYQAATRPRIDGLVPPDVF